ncbi:MAG: DUF11 domain-containing protein [Comamonadaceae bacterium]|nr:MAG: DUF11 domain-containing protein [Comamonadaceae bacterium]
MTNFPGRTLARVALWLAVACSGLVSVQAQTCAIPGMAGNATITASPNTYVPPAPGAVGAGATSLTLAPAFAVGTPAIGPGDRVLVIQMQDSSGTLEGNFEYAVVTSVSGAVYSLAAPLTKAYGQGFGTNLLQTFQVIRVPQYANLTISGTVAPPAWTIDAGGRGTGGVLVLDVSGNLTFAANSSLDASGKGFRGAFGINGTGNRAGGTPLDANYAPNLANVNGSLKGEGTNGVSDQLFVGTTTPASYTQGLYAVGTAGQAANGNAAGGGNDGVPPTGNNQFNSGGGGGGNAGAGGNGGINWDNNNAATQAAAGGRGGNAVANSNAKIYFGGGGGAGASNNNTGANAVTVYPPSATTTNQGQTTATSGASGAVSLSGSTGGGIVIVQANTITGAAGATIQANGYRAYATTGGSEGAGGAGAGGSILVYANSSTGNLAASATGGRGGDSNFSNHGPGGGGGGGYIGRSTGVAFASTAVTGGANGLDAANAGNNTSDAYGSNPGAVGTLATVAANPDGTTPGASCAPVLTVSKLALTPSIVVGTSATAQYSIVVNNAATAGGARNVDVIDNALPPGWTLAAAPTYAYSPSGAGTFASGAETAANVAGYSITASPTAAPTVVPTTGSNSLTWSSLFIAPGGAATITFTVNIPDTAGVGTYHNPAGVRFADITAAAGSTKVTPALQNSANRAGASYGNVAYASGAAVGGSNYNGLEAGPAGDDVRLLPDLSVTKTAPAQITAGAVFSYVLTPRNSGRAIGSQTFATSQATTVASANVPTVLGSLPLRVTDTLPATVTSTAAPTGTNWTCAIAGRTVTCDYFQATPASAYPLAAQTDLPPITLPVRMLQAGCGVGATNTAVISAAAGETATANNASTVVSTSNCAANLTITKSDSLASVTAGGTTSYAITLANLGPGSADGAVVADTPGAGLSCTAVTCTGSGGAVCTSPTPTLAALQAGLVIPTFPAASQVALTLLCAVTATGQ